MASCRDRVESKNRKIGSPTECYALASIPWPTSTAYIILSLKVLVLEVTVPLEVDVLGTGGPVNAPGPAGTLAR